MSMSSPQSKGDQSIKQIVSGKTIKTIDSTMEIKNHCLGQGGYGRVFACWDLQAKQVLAAKIISKEKVIAKINSKGNTLQKKEFYIKSFRSEVLIMISMNHPNILALNGFYESSSHLYFFTEYCNQGNLEALIKREKVVDLKKHKSLFLDLIEACLYLHKQRILHRDIKPSNILLHNGSVKLCDFGFATKMSEETKITDDFVVGTIEYMAPEVALKEPQIDEKSDVWSLGVTFFQMLFGYLPWPMIKHREDIQRIRNSTLVIPDKASVPTNIKIGLRRMLTFDRNLRASLEEIRNIFDV